MDLYRTDRNPLVFQFLTRPLPWYLADLSFSQFPALVNMARDKHDRESGESSSSKRRHHRDNDDRQHHHSSSSSSKRHRSSKHDQQDKHHRHKSSSKLSKHDSEKDKRRQDDDDDDEWVEKQASIPSISASLLSTERSTTTTTTTTSAPPQDSYGTFSVGEMRASTLGGLGSTSNQDNFTDGYGQGENGTTPGGSMLGDLFSNMGTERKRSQPKEKPDPTVSTHSSASLTLCLYR